MLLPAGKVAFGGCVDCNDVAGIWTALDKVHAKHPDKVLLHCGSPRGAERIATCWAKQRRVTDIPFKPDWIRERNAAPFKRNDRVLEVLPHRSRAQNVAVDRRVLVIHAMSKRAYELSQGAD